MEDIVRLLGAGRPTKRKGEMITTASYSRQKREEIAKTWLDWCNHLDDLLHMLPKELTNLISVYARLSCIYYPTTCNQHLKIWRVGLEEKVTKPELVVSQMFIKLTTSLNGRHWAPFVSEAYSHCGRDGSFFYVRSILLKDESKVRHCLFHFNSQNHKFTSFNTQDSQNLNTRFESMVCLPVTTNPRNEFFDLYMFDEAGNTLRTENINVKNNNLTDYEFTLMRKNDRLKYDAPFFGTAPNFRSVTTIHGCIVHRVNASFYIELLDDDRQNVYELPSNVLSTVRDQECTLVSDETNNLLHLFVKHPALWHPGSWHTLRISKQDLETPNHLKNLKWNDMPIFNTGSQREWQGIRSYYWLSTSSFITRSEVFLSRSTCHRITSTPFNHHENINRIDFPNNIVPLTH